MTLQAAVCWIGVSHLLQPPLAILLTRRLQLGQALSAAPPLLAQVMRNMVVASIALPTALGVLLALHAQEAVAPGPGRSLAWLLAAFWSWRLVRQCRGRAAWCGNSGRSPPLHWLLSAIFLVQGPGLAALLAFASLGS